MTDVCVFVGVCVCVCEGERVYVCVCVCVRKQYTVLAIHCIVAVLHRRNAIWRCERRQRSCSVIVLLTGWLHRPCGGAIRLLLLPLSTLSTPPRKKPQRAS